MRLYVFVWDCRSYSWRGVLCLCTKAGPIVLLFATLLCVPAQPCVLAAAESIASFPSVVLLLLGFGWVSFVAGALPGARGNDRGTVVLCIQHVAAAGSLLRAKVGT